MNTLPVNEIYDGQATAPAEPVPLRAGPVTMNYHHGDLRTIKLGEHEILRRIYVAVRDRHWHTIPLEVSRLQMDIRPDSFRLQFDADHQQADIDFGWHGTITGSADGSLVFKLAGEARTTFWRNRIGFCVLHPMTLAGQPCNVQHVDGATTFGRFPEQIAPHQPFLDIRTISHDVTPGVQAEVSLSGDVFEMEDQRNWTDASFKTYSTPLEEPIPVEIPSGTTITQIVRLRLSGDFAHIPPAEPQPLTFTLHPPAGTTLPRLGLGVASHDGALSDTEIERLRALHLSHLRAEVHLGRADAVAALRRATDQARALDVKLEVAVYVTDRAAEELVAFRAALDDIRPPVALWAIFHEDELSTAARWITLARDHLAGYDPDAKFASGTDNYFTDINRQHPPVELLDVVTYSLNPQVHAFDNLSLVESLETQGVTVANARHFSGQAQISVSPITLKKRRADAALPPGELPPQVCVRQMSLFGAGWTVGSLKYLSEAGLDRATYYETTGWLGVMETASGSPLPEQFRSIPGGVFPLYHVLADAGEFAGASLICSESSDPLAVDGLALRQHDALRVLIASYSRAPQSVIVRGLSGTVTVHMLDESNAGHAMREPESFRDQPGQSVDVSGVGFVLRLAPYAIVRLDAQLDVHPGARP